MKTLSLCLGSLAAIMNTEPPNAQAADPTRELGGRTRNVAIVLYDGVELLDFAGPGEVFSAASSIGALRGQPAFRVYTVAVSTAPITSQRFLKVIPDYALEDAPPPDLIVLPGGSSNALTDSAPFMSWVHKAIASAEISMSVCTGAFVLSKAGALDGKTATTWFGATQKLRQDTPKATVQDGRRFVDEGRIITTAGVSAGIDGALHVVARLLGRAIADRTARYMEYHWTPEAYLAQSYSSLNPGLTDRGRAVQRATLLESEKNWADAARAYKALTQEDSKDGFLWSRLAFVNFRLGDKTGAIAASKRAIEFPEFRADALVNIACFYSRDGKTKEALGALEDAIAAGFKAKSRLQNDEDLASLRIDPRFQKLVARL